MTSLDEAQAVFQHYVLSGSRRAELLPLIAPGPRGNHERRLQIYYDAYRLRLVEALSTDFEALAAVLGAEDFRSACLAYVDAAPSVYRNVRWYGAGFADFLAIAQPRRQAEWVAELARFEWTLTLAFDAADAPCASFEELATLPSDAWSRLQLALHPSLHCLGLYSNAPAMRLAVDAAVPLPQPKVDLEPVDWAVWRNDATVHFRSITAVERWALDAVREGRSFPEICAGLCDLVGESDAPAHAATFLRAWVEDQVISALLIA
jgi:hypothetical protein